MTIEHFTRNGYTVKIWHDEDTEDPRDFDNLGTLTLHTWSGSLATEDSRDADDYDGWDEMKSAILREHPRAVILPVYQYEHSGTALSTTPFSCGWDSGQVGFIYAPLDEVRSTYAVKAVTAKVRAHAEGALAAEVSVYGEWLNGETYGYTVEDPTRDDDGEADSCGGYIGWDWAVSEATEAADRLPFLNTDDPTA